MENRLNRDQDRFFLVEVHFQKGHEFGDIRFDQSSPLRELQRCICIDDVNSVRHNVSPLIDVVAGHIFEDCTPSEGIRKLKDEPIQSMLISRIERQRKVDFNPCALNEGHDLSS